MWMLVLRKKMSPLTIAVLNSRPSPRGHKKRTKSKKLFKKPGMKGLRTEMVEARSEQKRIKEEKRHVNHKLKAIGDECEQLRLETTLIIHQSANTQLRLALMFQILQAREHNDFSRAAELTKALRVLIMEQQKA